MYSAWLHRCADRVFTYLCCGGLDVELAAAAAAAAAAIDEMPGSCWWEWDAVVEVELGRDIGSRVGGGGRLLCPSSIFTPGEMVKGGSPI